MTNLRQILDAIQELPLSDRLRLLVHLKEDVELEQPVASEREVELPPGSLLERRGKFYVFTGSIDEAATDHRVDREQRIDQLIARIDASSG